MLLSSIIARYWETPMSAWSTAPSQLTRTRTPSASEAPSWWPATRAGGRATSLWGSGEREQGGAIRTSSTPIRFEMQQEEKVTFHPIPTITFFRSHQAKLYLRVPLVQWCPRPRGRVRPTLPSPRLLRRLDWLPLPIRGAVARRLPNSHNLGQATTTPREWMPPFRFR